MFHVVIVGREAMRLLRMRPARKCLCRKMNRGTRDYNLFPTTRRIGICSKIPMPLKEK